MKESKQKMESSRLMVRRHPIEGFTIVEALDQSSRAPLVYKEDETFPLLADALNSQPKVNMLVHPECLLAPRDFKDAEEVKLALESEETNQSVLYAALDVLTRAAELRKALQLEEDLRTKDYMRPYSTVELFAGRLKLRGKDKTGSFWSLTLPVECIYSPDALKDFALN